MFALRIEFHDGVSAPETLLVRRSDAIVGASEGAHVVLEGASSAITEFSLVRGLGREFYCRSVIRRSNTMGSFGSPSPVANQGSVVDGAIPTSVFDGVAELELGEVLTRIWSLDLDLLPIVVPQFGSSTSGNEPPDKAALRTLRSALCYRTPIFPAFVMIGESVAVYSLRPDMKILVGRSRRCHIRTDAAGVVNEHAHLWCDGHGFAISPHPSSGGVGVDGQLVTSGAVQFSPLTRVRVGTVEIVGLHNVEDLQVLREELLKRPHYQVERRAYPSLVIKGPTIGRAQRFAFGRKTRLIVGRDPACDIWLQDVHISSEHLQLSLEESGDVVVVDGSSNGTFFGGSRLERGKVIRLNKKYSLFDLQLGLELAVCFSPNEESKYFPELVQDSGEVTKVRPIELPVFRCEKALLGISKLNVDSAFFGVSERSLEHRSLDIESKLEDEFGGEENSDYYEDRSREVPGLVNHVNDANSFHQVHNSLTTMRTEGLIGDASSGAGLDKHGQLAKGRVSLLGTSKTKSSKIKRKSEMRGGLASADIDGESERPTLSGTQKAVMGMAVFGLLATAVIITVALLTK